MYKGFNLSINNDKTVFFDYENIGEAVTDGVKSTVYKTLKEVADNKGRISGTALMSDWFPGVVADVFISHSHKDEKLAIGLAGFLKKSFGLNSFIDSCIWGYADELLLILDKEYCWRESSGFYDYKTRNKTTSHVNVMLSTALANMIDNCEIVIFLNTPNSISCEGFKTESATESPWIYTELFLTKVIEKRMPIRNIALGRTAVLESIKNNLSIKYDLNFQHLHDVDENLFMLWKENSKATGSSSLDILYSLVNGE